MFSTENNSLTIKNRNKHVINNRNISLRSIQLFYFKYKKKLTFLKKKNQITSTTQFIDRQLFNNIYLIKLPKKYFLSFFLEYLI